MIKYDRKAAEYVERSYSTSDLARQRLQTLQALALNAGEHVLDIGCGSGFLAAEMALLVGESGHVLGIDNSPEMLKAGEKRCANLPQLELQLANASELPLADNSADAISGIQVLLYVPELTQALSEIYRVLKPGGRIALIETDWHGLLLNSRDAALTQRITSAWEQAVPNPQLAPVLGSMLRAGGFSALRIDAIPILNTNITPANFSAELLPWFADMAQQQGAASEEETNAWLHEMQQKAEQGDYFFCVNRFLFSAVK